MTNTVTGIKWDSTEDSAIYYYEADKMEMIFKRATEIVHDWQNERGQMRLNQNTTIISIAFVI